MNYTPLTLLVHTQRSNLYHILKSRDQIKKKKLKTNLRYTYENGDKKTLLNLYLAKSHFNFWKKIET